LIIARARVLKVVDRSLAKVDGQRWVRVLLSNSWGMEMQVSKHNGEEQNDA
jgi:hypothetical protein